MQSTLSYSYIVNCVPSVMINSLQSIAELYNWS